MTTKTEVIAAIDAALAVANALDDQAATIAQLTQEKTDALAAAAAAQTLAGNRMTAINAMKAKIIEANEVDVAEEAADTAGDAARADALAIANAAV